MTIFEQSQLDVRSNNNLLINGDFTVWQRGTSFVQSGEVYTADRVKVQSSIADWEAHQIGGEWNNGLIGKKWMQRIRGTGSYENTIFSVEDGANLYKGKTLTFTVRGKFSQGVIYPVRVRRSATGSGGDSVIAGSFVGGDSIDQNHSFTFTLPNSYDKTKVNLLVQVEHLNESDKAISHFYDVKLELGSVSTAFIRNDPATNIAQCQRYYFKDEASFANTVYAHPLSSIAQYWGLLRQWPVRMRKVPTIDYKISGFSSAKPQVSAISVDSAYLQWGNTTANTYGGIQSLTADAEL